MPANLRTSTADSPAATVSDRARGNASTPSARLGKYTDASQRNLECLLADLDPDRLAGGDACTLYEALCQLARMVDTARAIVAPRIESSGAWKESGERSCSSFLASMAGDSPGQARSILEIGRALSELPRCEKAAREGSLSRPKLAELTSALASEPDRERELLSGAASEPLWATKERCQRARATSKDRDPIAAVKRIRAGRHLTWWSDPEGAFCFQGRDTADRGAAMRARLEELASDLRRQRAGETGEPETPRDSDGALRMDALFALVTECPHRPTRSNGARQKTRSPRKSSTSSSESPSREDDGAEHSIVNRPPRCNVLVRVDLDALLRGRAHRGECCEIDGHGPIPAPMARDLVNDSFLRLVFHQAGDIKAVSALGRTIKRPLRIALAARDRHCVVPGCGAASGLEIDHVVPFSQGGPTELDNLALLCHHHHFLKTYDGWTLTRIGTARDGTPEWSFDPLPPFGQESDLGIDTDEGRASWRRQQE